MKPFSYLFAVLGLSVVVQCAGAQTIDMPTVKEGDSWEFQNYDMWSGRMTSSYSKQVIGVMGEYVRVSYDTREISKTGEIGRPVQSDATLRADMNATAVVGGQKYERSYYKWPLEVGKRWTSQFKSDLPANGNASAGAVPQFMTTTLECEVKEWETIIVPAGKFKALKIVAKGNWTIGSPATSSGSYTAIRWYSPDAKAEVQYTYDAFGADGTPLTRTKQQLGSYNLK
jgi:hypothetical protein